MEPPFPIPNREVKRFSADNSFPATGYENRSWPESRNQNDSIDLPAGRQVVECKIIRCNWRIFFVI